MAFLVSLLRWPDRRLPWAFYKGFKVIGHLEHSGIFNEKVMSEISEEEISESFFGKPAEEFLAKLLQRKPGEFAQKLHELAMKEVNRRRFSQPVSIKTLNKRYGKGGWRAMPLFLIEQKGKFRLISDARQGEHNKFTSEDETIFTISIEFVIELLNLVSRSVKASRWGSANGDWLPPWAAPSFQSDDLDEAYAQCPGHPEHRKACIVGWPNPHTGKWMFAEANGLVFGLRAAVLAFNRWPTLMVAASRRLFATLSGNYFDDFGLADTRASAGSGRRCQTRAAAMCGGSFGDPKAFPPGYIRNFVGVSLRLDGFSRCGEVLLEPKEECLLSISEKVDGALASMSLSSGQASKLRGQLGWASTNLFARMGRTGMAALKTRQYFEKDSRVLHGSRLHKALIFLKYMLPFAPARRILLSKPASPPIIVYSDASWPSIRDGEKMTKIPRIGWVIFQQGEKPIGVSCIANESILKHLIDRSTQILAVESFAAVAAPWVSPHLFSGRDVIWWIDNLSAMSSLVRGAARPEDIDIFASMAALQFAALRCRPWYEWVDSDSNPSDGLSRDGVKDAWTLQQGWDLYDLGDMDWSEVFYKYDICNP